MTALIIVVLLTLQHQHQRIRGSQSLSLLLAAGLPPSSSRCVDDHTLCRSYIHQPSIAATTHPPQPQPQPQPQTATPTSANLGTTTRGIHPRNQLELMADTPPPPPPESRRDVSSTTTSASQQGSSSTRTPATTSAVPRRLQTSALKMAPTAPPAPRSQFHRFRLSEFQRVETPSASPAGQCSRFRVSDFVPYGSASSDGQQAQPQLNGASPAASGSGNTASPRTNQPNRQHTIPGAGSYSVLHMDIEASPPQQTSDMVASTGGRGVLHKVPAPKGSSTQFPNPQQPPNGHPRSIVPAPAQGPAPAIPPPVVKFNPAQYPEDVRWELARVLGNIQTNPTEFTNLVVNALLTAPSFEENSLLRHIGALYPLMQPPAHPPAPPQPEADPDKSVKRKRGRPSTKKNVAPAQITAAAQPPNATMGPPLITVIPSRKDKDTIQTCTRCLKPFNPSWRPTPASDPSSETTCAVRHPYPDFASGLVVSLQPRKRNNYKTTWRWRCCGREIQSGDENAELPRKEDDKTGGWCFVGKHTTEPGVREKFGLKPGKGKTIDEVADISDTAAENARKRTKVDGDNTTANGTASNATATPGPATRRRTAQTAEPPPQQQQQQQQQQQPPPQQQQHSWSPADAYAQDHSHTQTPQPPQPGPSTQPDQAPAEEPVKRKRGRPKGSKSKNKLLGLTTTIPSPSQISPGAQLLADASQAEQQNNTPLHARNGSGSNFWSQYGDPVLPDLADGDAEHEDEEPKNQHVESMGMSSVQLGMLVSATAAMGGQSNLGAQSTVETPPVKRGRGRPKGVKNGAGKAAIEKKRQEEEAARQQQLQQHEDQDPEPHPEPAVANTIPAGAGGGWFPGDDQPWGGFV
ncbi:hypothetical protein K440DRAFT_658200 [Wilcoxina mikolae CBS 423.85]|nr:hypothetical protein K440DRAFT_658200 [Wilcoxina mikolae CBS 423.85]